jgi:hypothetical protein
MQLSNGAIKVKAASAAALATKVEENEFEGMDLETFDLSAFVAPKPGAIAVRGTGKEIRNPEVEKFLKESANLLALGEKYEVEVVERGHQALYELLASIYGLALRIDQHEQREKILDAIRSELKETRQISIKSGTSAINTMVKYVVRSDNRVISRYTKVLNVAREENLDPTDLASYITRRGGVGQIQEVEAKALAKKSGDKSSKERTALIREYFELMGTASKMDLEFSGNVIFHGEEKDGKPEASSFCVFVAHHISGDQYKIISANDLGRNFEDSLVKYLGKAMPNDLKLLEKGVRNYKQQIMIDSSQPESIRRKMKEQLAQPLKYAKVEVIDVEASFKDDEA